MVNSKKIKNRIKELGLTHSFLVDKLGIAQATLTQKINNMRSTKLEEAFIVSEILQISDIEFKTYFFIN